MTSHVLPDESGHNIPLTDGFKILRGAVWGISGVNRDSTRYFSGSPAWFSGYRFTQDPCAAFNGGVTTGDQLANTYLAHFMSNFNPDNSVRVEVRFDAMNPQKAYRMRRTGPNTEYQLQTSVLLAAPGGEPFVNVPFQVWDVSNPSSPRQLTVSWRDQNDNALWDPPEGSDGTEVVFIHFRTYDPLGRQFTYPTNPDKPGPVVNDEATMGAEADIMYGLSLAVLPGHVLSESPGILKVHPSIGLTTADRFVFQTEVVSAAPTLSSPAPGANNVNRQERFMWNPSEGADFYTLQVSRNDSLFRYLSYNDSTLTTTYLPTDTTGTSTLDWGTKYYWRVNGRNPYGVSAWSGMRSFTTGLASVPSSWNYTSLTGRNATVAVPVSSHPSIGRRAMQTGDAIGLFYMRNDTMICAGYGSWKDGSNLVVTIWGDNDQTTTIKDGFAEGEQLTYRAWDAIAGRYFPATVTYESGGPTFATDGIYLLSSFTANTNAKHSIPLPQGWNMISTCLIPNDSSLTSVLVDALPSMVLLKNGRGQVFWPSLSVNTIGKWNPLHGYQIYTTSTDTVWVCGDEAVPQSIPVYLQRGWNLTAYLRTSGLGVDIALATISDYLVIAKNNFGDIFAPSLGINTLGPMRRGQGYQMYLTNNATLVYPANKWFALVYLLPGESPPPGVSTQSTPTRFVCSLGPTGSNAILVAEWEGFHDGDEVAVWNSDRKLIGSAVARNGKAIITVWGDNVMTDKVIEGAREEEPLQLSLWSPTTDRVCEISNVGITNLLDAEEKIPGLSFRQDAFWKVHLSDAGTIPTTMVLAQNYPNPFNPSTVIRYGIPFNSRVVIEVFNILGQRVTTLVDTDQGAGFYEVMFEGYRYASGVYIYRMRAGSFSESKKMIILR